MASSRSIRSRRLAQARSPETATARLRDLARFSETHRLLARNCRTPEDVLHGLAKSADSRVLVALARNRSTATKTLVRLAKPSSTLTLHKSLLARAHLPDKVAIALAQSSHYRIKVDLANRESLPVDSLRLLASEHQNTIRWDVSNHGDTPADVLDVLSRDPDQGFAANVAKHANVSPETLARLAAHPDPVVRLRVAEAATTTDTTLRKLADDVEPSVRFALVRRDTAPVSLLVHLAEFDEDLHIRRDAARALRAEPIQSVQQLRARSQDVWTRHAVASEGPPDISGSLATDPDATVRQIALKRGVITDADALYVVANRKPVEVVTLMRNPHPLDAGVLEQAMRHPNEHVRISLAGRADLSASTLQRLSSDPEGMVRINVARNPLTETWVIEKLVHDPDRLVQRWARRRAAEPDIEVPQQEPIRRIGEARSHSTYAERQVELATLGDLATRLALARNTAICLEAQQVVAATPDSQVQTVLGSNRHIAVATMKTLSGVVGEYRVHLAVARNRALPTSLRKQLLVHPSQAVRWGMAQRSDLDDEDFGVLASDLSVAVRRACAKNPHTPAQHLVTLAAYQDAATRRSITKHRRATDDALAIVADDPSCVVRYDVALQIKKLSAETKRLLGNDTSHSIRFQIAKDSKAAPSVLHAVSLLPGNDLTVAGHPRAAQETLRSYLCHPRWYCREQAFIRLKTLTDAEFLSGSNDPSWCVRRAVAERSDTPVSCIDALSFDRDHCVRSAAASHARLSPVRLVALAADPVHRVHRAVVSNQNSPAEALAAITCKGLVMATTRHPNIGTGQLRVFAAAKEPYIRAAVARHANLDRETIYRLFKDRSPWVRNALAVNPSTPNELLAKLAGSDEHPVRVSVARNPNASAETLAQLADDPHKSVRQVAARNPATPAAERVLAALG